MFSSHLHAAIERLLHGPLALFFLFVCFVIFLKAFLAWRNGGGKRGERQVNRALRKLPASHYRLYPDLYLPVDGGTTQIDHLIVSPYGIFVIETKEMRGVIYGREKEAKWTQRLGGKSYPFQNPLRQNYGHLQAVAAITGETGPLISVVVLAGSATFPKERPANVLPLTALLSFILSHQIPLLDTEATQEAAHRIEGAAIPNTRTTRKAHIAFVGKKLINS